MGQHAFPYKNDMDDYIAYLQVKRNHWQQLIGVCAVHIWFLLILVTVLFNLTRWYF